jgi:hypothetical protein
MSRFVFMLGAALCILAIAFLLTLHLVIPPFVCLEHARQIRLGMTRHQVQAVFGRPADDTMLLLDWMHGLQGSWQKWRDRTGVALIHFRCSENEEETVRWVKYIHRSTAETVFVLGNPEQDEVVDDWAINLGPLETHQERPGLLERLWPNVEKTEKDGW